MEADRACTEVDGGRRRGVAPTEAGATRASLSADARSLALSLPLPFGSPNRLLSAHASAQRNRVVRLLTTAAIVLLALGLLWWRRKESTGRSR